MEHYEIIQLIRSLIIDFRPKCSTNEELVSKVLGRLLKKVPLTDEEVPDYKGTVAEMVYNYTK